MNENTKEKVKANPEEIERIKREIKENIKSKLNELKKERKRLTDLEEEQRKKEREWEIRIKLMEVKGRSTDFYITHNA